MNIKIDIKFIYVRNATLTRVIMELPADIIDIIYDFKNDIEYVEKHKHGMRDVFRELHDDADFRVWCEFSEMMWDYHQVYREWRYNDPYFDPEYTTDVVNGIYEFYRANVESIFRYVEYNYRHCVCCKCCENRRVRLDEFVIGSSRASSKYIIQYCGCGCVNACNEVHMVEHRLLWTEHW